MKYLLSFTVLAGVLIYASLHSRKQELLVSTPIELEYLNPNREEDLEIQFGGTEEKIVTESIHQAVKLSMASPERSGRSRELLKKIEEELQEFQKVNPICEEQMAELLESHLLIDPRSSFYADPENGMQLAHSALTGTLYLYHPMQTYRRISELAFLAEESINPRQVIQYQMQLQGCLSPRVEGFLMTFFDAAYVQNYPEAIKKRIASYIINTYFQTSLLAPPTLISLSFKLNILNSMAQNQLISSYHLPQIESLQLQLLEGHQVLSEAVFEDERTSIGQKWREVQTEMRARESIAHEIRDLIAEL